MGCNKKIGYAPGGGAMGKQKEQHRSRQKTEKKGQKLE